jgi:ArsR family transcriptional regulator, arsenate/arsenite/antimonite-responsive transcriptional repressor
MATATSHDVKRAARRFHALSDATRLEIVRLLSHGERCVCELQDALDAAQSRLSFHLRTLKQAGLVSDRREGRWVYYALSPDALDEIGTFAAAVQPGRHAGSCRTACCERKEPR